MWLLLIFVIVVLACIWQWHPKGEAIVLGMFFGIVIGAFAASVFVLKSLDTAAVVFAVVSIASGIGIFFAFSAGDKGPPNRASGPYQWSSSPRDAQTTDDEADEFARFTVNSEDYKKITREFSAIGLTLRTYSRLDVAIPSTAIRQFQDQKGQFCRCLAQLKRGNDLLLSILVTKKGISPFQIVLIIENKEEKSLLKTKFRLKKTAGGFYYAPHDYFSGLLTHLDEVLTRYQSSTAKRSATA